MGHGLAKVGFPQRLFFCSVIGVKGIHIVPHGGDINDVVNTLVGDLNSRYKEGWE